MKYSMIKVPAIYNTMLITMEIISEVVSRKTPLKIAKTCVKLLQTAYCLDGFTSNLIPLRL